MGIKVFLAKLGSAHFGFIALCSFSNIFSNSQILVSLLTLQYFSIGSMTMKNKNSQRHLKFCNFQRYPVISDSDVKDSDTEDYSVEELLTSECFLL